MSWQNAFMSDYERIATVIRYLDAHHTEQPDLATLASYVGLSPSHFHRLFSAWAGVTPKDFLQCLTLAHARTLLHSGENVLNTALNSGLSGPGRLHDLCINLESASPGEMKSGGAGWTITFGFADTPFGACLVGENTRGICHLSFVDTRDEGALNRLNRDWPRAQFHRNDAAAAQLVHRVFDSSVGIQHKLPLRAFVKGTPFQVRVWRALLQVQPGQLVTYGSLAAAIGRPAALMDDALSRASEDIEVLFVRGTICHNLPGLFNRQDDARRDFNKIIELLPDNLHRYDEQFIADVLDYLNEEIDLNEEDQTALNKINSTYSIAAGESE